MWNTEELELRQLQGKERWREIDRQKSSLTSAFKVAWGEEMMRLHRSFSCPSPKAAFCIAQDICVYVSVFNASERESGERERAFAFSLVRLAVALVDDGEYGSVKGPITV